MLTPEKLLFAGLSELEANEALCKWLLARLTANGCCLHEDDYRVYVYEGRAMSIGLTPVHVPLFNESHDAIHRILNVMNDEEKLRLFRWFHHEFDDSDKSLFFGSLFATPAQKTVAALRALGLGKEGK